MSVLVIDVGTTGLRAAVVRNDGSVAHLNYELCSPTSPFAGLVEFDALAMRDAVLRVAHKTLAAAGNVDAVGIDMGPSVLDATRINGGVGRQHWFANWSLIVVARLAYGW